MIRATNTKIKQRRVIKEDKRQDVLTNGDNNAYPSEIESVILNSVTAKSAAAMYANFLVGDGFKDLEINNIVVGYQNYKPITLYKLLNKVALSIAYQNGFFLQTNWLFNGSDYLIDNINPLQFKNCRLGNPDDKDYSAKIVLYDNWDRLKSSQVRTNDFNKIDVFNARSEVVKSQIEKSGGWNKYKGQIYFEFFDDEFNYPLSLIDAARDDADTEYQISKFKNGELSRNFFAKYILRHAYFENDMDKQRFVEQIEGFQGGENNGSLMLVEDDIGQDETGEVTDNGLKFEKIEQNINDKLFIDWEKSIANNIRKSFKAIPTVLIEYVEGKLGNTSGESLRAAADFYNQMTAKDRAKISDSFLEIFKKYKTPIESDFEILPLTFGKEAINE